jgi:hypothetical protein
VSAPDSRHGAFVPLLLVLVTLLLWFGFQTSQLLKERENLATLRSNQEAIYANAQKMRAQLEAIAADTARLAQAGHPHAAQWSTRCAPAASRSTRTLRPSPPASSVLARPHAASASAYGRRA